jgi:hypothetical protein
VRVSVTGVPEVRVAETQALIRTALAPLQAAGVIMICAHHLNNGEWLLMGFDGVKLEALKGELVEHLLQALRALPGF